MKIMDMVQKIAFVVMIIGVAGMDSESLIIPMAMTLIGASTLFVASALEYEDGEEEK